MVPSANFSLILKTYFHESGFFKFNFSSLIVKCKDPKQAARMSTNANKWRKKYLLTFYTDEISNQKERKFRREAERSQNFVSTNKTQAKRQKQQNSGGMVCSPGVLL